MVREDKCSKSEGLSCFRSTLHLRPWFNGVLDYAVGSIGFLPCLQSMWKSLFRHVVFSQIPTAPHFVLFGVINFPYFPVIGLTWLLVRHELDNRLKRETRDIDRDHLNTFTLWGLTYSRIRESSFFSVFKFSSRLPEASVTSKTFILSSSTTKQYVGVQTNDNSLLLVDFASTFKDLYDL